MTPDRTDFAVLALLQNNARLSNKELAARLGIAPSTCLERVRRLRDEGVLGPAHAEVDPAALGIGLQALIAVRLQQQTRALVDAFHHQMMARAEVRAVYHLAGADDFLVHVAVRDAAHLRDFALDQISGRPEVQHVETAIVFRYERNALLPNYALERAADA
jgi:DNA-binding Lrp family transcriptional regulator